MNISTDSHFTSLVKAITRFFGIDLFVTILVLIAPISLLSWTTRNLALFNKDFSHSSIYGPYVLVAVIFTASAFRRNILLAKEGLQSSGTNPRAVWGNLLVVMTVMAILFKRNLTSSVDNLMKLDRMTIAIDLLFIWVVANFLAQLVRLVLQFFKSSKGK